jgi:hypothetical protein
MNIFWGQLGGLKMWEGAEQETNEAKLRLEILNKKANLVRVGLIYCFATTDNLFQQCEFFSFCE